MPHLFSWEAPGAGAAARMLGKSDFHGFSYNFSRFFLQLAI